MELLQRHLPAGSFALAVLGCALWSCSSAPEPNASEGGKPGSGGALATAGSPATGGAAVTAGSPATGGAPATAGASSGGTGGSETQRWCSHEQRWCSHGRRWCSHGRRWAATGGAGAATGGTGTGGKGGGASGGSTAGGPAAGGAAGGSQPKTSPGCGSTSPLKSGNFTETINGTLRKWMVDVPANYDASKPYRLIFVWHPLGGSGSHVVERRLQWPEVFGQRHCHLCYGRWSQRGATPRPAAPAGGTSMAAT